MQKISIGTRKSKLAMWQATYIANRLQREGWKTEIVSIETKGDETLKVSIAKIGSKGVFTQEIEEQLINGTIDIAVHSAKDMQSVLPKGLELIAFAERERVHEVVVSTKEDFHISEPGIIGTSSTRRIALLKYYYPHINTVPVRGNLKTRVDKMREGVCDGLLLAYAGVHRMGYDEMIACEFATDQFVPAVGQGSIAIECAIRLPKDKKQQVRALTNDQFTETRLLAERAYLRKLEGGCSIPVFALADGTRNNMTLTGGIISLDGKNLIQETVKIDTDNPEQAGVQLAEKVFALGGNEILKKIKRDLK